MANMDFVIVPLSTYIRNHIQFGNKLKQPPKVYAMNYFLKGEGGTYLNTKLDKRVWVLWAEGRVHGEFGAIKTPIGYIPKYKDLVQLFRGIFNGRKYNEEEYSQQFSIRIAKYLEKYERMDNLYEVEPGMPEEFWTCLKNSRTQLEELRQKYGKDVVYPFELEDKNDLWE